MRLRTAFFWLLLLTSTAPADPSWWAARGVQSTVPAANLAPATIGQAKHMAAMALAELSGHLDAPAFQALQTDLAAIVDLTLPNPLPPGFHDSQRAILLTGQLKAIAKPFYDHLRTHDAAWLDNAMTLGNLIVMEPGSNPPTPSPYPWSEATTDDANRAPATLGQLKAVFSLPLETLASTPALDTDGDGMPDAWEIQNGFNPNNSADATGDSDGDGINNVTEFQYGLSPNSVDIVGPVNIGFDKEITEFPTFTFRPTHPSDLYEAGDQSNSSVSGWKAATGQHIEIWDEGDGNPYAELQSHMGAHGISQEFWMLPGTSVTFILRYKGRYDSWDGVIDNAFTLKVEGAEAFELRVNGDVVTSNNSVRSHPFMESDTGNQWASWHSATVTITELGNGSYLAPFLLSLVPNTTTSGGEEITHGGFVDILPFEFNQVSFSGDKYWELWSDKGHTDSGGKVYDAPHWLDTSGNGKSDNQSAGDHNYPVAYSRGSTPKIGAKIRLKAPNGITPVLKATGPGSVVIPPTLLVNDPLQADSWSLPNNTQAGELANTIKYYSAQENGKEFRLSWSLSLDGQMTWSKVKDTDHTVYVTFGDPIDKDVTPGMGRHFQETLFNIGCRNADGQSDNTNNSIVDSIYQEFKDQNVCKVIPSQGIRENEPLLYWKDYSEEIPIVAGAYNLLKCDNRNGDCGAWASLLSHIIRNQGIDSRQVELKSTSGPMIEGLLVKNWTFMSHSIPHDSIPGYPYFEGNTGNVYPSSGIPHQGNTDGGKGTKFNVHIIMISSNYLYDPSYGTEKISPINGLPDYKKYEDEILSGYDYRGDQGNLPQSLRHCRKNNTEISNPCEVSPNLLVPSN